MNAQNGYVKLHQEIFFLRWATPNLFVSPAEKNHYSHFEETKSNAPCFRYENNGTGLLMPASVLEYSKSLNEIVQGQGKQGYRSISK